MTPLEDLERRVAALEKKPRRIEAAENDILEAARQWARVTQLGFYMDDGVRNHVGGTDAKDAAEFFEKKMRTAAVNLLRTEAT